jgi:hypothetical protein
MNRLRRSRWSGFAGLSLAAWAALGQAPTVVAAPALAAMPILAATPPATATPPQEGLAVIRGVLYQADEVTRVKGATVTAINVRTGRRYVSNFTGENGAYEVTGLPAGTYDIVLDNGTRLFVAESLVDLADKQRLFMSFSMQPKGAAAPGVPADQGEAKMTFTDPNAVPASTAPPKKKGFWKSGGGIAIITILVVGALGAGVAAQHN